MEERPDAPQAARCGELLFPRSSFGIRKGALLQVRYNWVAEATSILLNFGSPEEARRIFPLPPGRVFLLTQRVVPMGARVHTFRIRKAMSRPHAMSRPYGGHGRKGITMFPRIRKAFFAH